METRPWPLSSTFVWITHHGTPGSSSIGERTLPPWRDGGRRPRMLRENRSRATPGWCGLNQSPLPISIDKRLPERSPLTLYLMQAGRQEVWASSARRRLSHGHWRCPHGKASHGGSVTTDRADWTRRSWSASITTHVWWRVGTHGKGAVSWHQGAHRPFCLACEARIEPPLRRASGSLLRLRAQKMWPVIASSKPTKEAATTYRTPSKRPWKISTSCVGDMLPLRPPKARGWRLRRLMNCVILPLNLSRATWCGALVSSAIGKDGKGFTSKR